MYLFYSEVRRGIILRKLLRWAIHYGSQAFKPNKSVISRIKFNITVYYFGNDRVKCAFPLVSSKHAQRLILEINKGMEMGILLFPFSGKGVSLMNVQEHWYN